MSKHTNPEVGVIMGSKSDLPIMAVSSGILSEFKVPHEVRIISAHRTPDRMREYGRTAVERGLKAIIAGAGGSAHLQGMESAYTRLPIFGVAINKKLKASQAAEASQDEMPKGVPLAYMGENEEGATNAALQVVRFMAVYDTNLAHQYDQYMLDMQWGVENNDDDLQKKGTYQFMVDEGLID
jgi:phosphoribosylaminoimidazole carboxylase PurE protein